MCEGLQNTAVWQLNMTREIDVPESAIKIIHVDVLASGSALSLPPARNLTTSLAKVSHEPRAYFMFE